MRPTPEQLKLITRGTVLLVDLDPSLGAEQAKTRPCVVVSSDTYNSRLTTLNVVPISSLGDKKPYPHEVLIPQGEGDLPNISVAQPVQIRTIDRNKRVVKILGRLSTQTMARVGASMFAVLGGLP